MDAVAAVAQRADLGFLGDPQLSPVLDHLLVCRPDPRSRHLARPRHGPRRAQASTARLALGWRGSARHWRLYEIYHTTMACARPCRWSCSLHSVVGLDFAASLMPGWQETIFPPYFVVGAMYSGFAMVVVLAALVRWGFRLQALITLEHFDVMAKIMLAASLIMGAVLRHRMVHRLVRRRARRARLVVFRSPAPTRRSTGACCSATCVAAAGVLVCRACAAASPRSWRSSRPHQYRHVARAHPDRLEHAVARLLPEHVAAVPADNLGLARCCSARSASSRCCS